MAKKEVKKNVVKEDVYSDIIHEVKDGVLYDIYLHGNKVVKTEISKE